MAASSPALDYLFGLELFGVKFGLDNISALAESLGHPERSFRSIHVAGTNGKGSVTAILDEALRAAGYRCGRYTSPHLVSVTERFAVDGQAVDAATLDRTIDGIRRAIDSLIDTRRLAASPTFFEATTAIAFEIFRRAQVQIAVCEVGLGGRLDATNILQPEVCVITSIGLDHQQQLGTTIPEIAREKAGIIKPGVPVIAGPMDPAAFAVIAAVAAERGAPLVAAGRDSTVEVVDIGEPNKGPRENEDSGLDLDRPKTANDAAGAGTAIRLRTPVRDYGTIMVGLAGDHQRDNALVAVRTLETLAATVPIGEPAIRQGLSNARWPGRLDLRRLPDGRELLLDAAHNPDGAEMLARYLSHGRARLPLVFGAMRDKDHAAMLARLGPAVASIVFTRAGIARAADPDDLAATARAVGLAVPFSVEPSPLAAAARAWTGSRRIVIAGSIALLGDVLEGLGLV